MTAPGKLKQGMLAGAMILAGVSHAWAALAPNYQRIAEFEAILGDAAVTEALKVRPIDRIEFVKTDLYRVTAGACHADVAIVDKPGDKRPGPRQFTVKVTTSTCSD